MYIYAVKYSTFIQYSHGKGPVSLFKQEHPKPSNPNHPTCH